MKVHISNYKSLNLIKPLVTFLQFKPYHYYNINNQRLNEYFFTLIKKEDIILVIKEKEKILGASVIVDLPWDSNIFGIKMAKISFILPEENLTNPMNIINQLLLNILSLGKEKNIKHLSCQINPHEFSLIHALEINGFKLMDTIVIHSISLKGKIFKSEKIDLKYVIREANQRDWPAMQELAGTAFFTSNIFLSRFYVDSLLKKNTSKLYKEWLSNSFKGEQADIVFVADIDGKAVGFITCRLLNRKLTEILNKKIGIIPLNAVSSKFRGQGIYTQLLKHSLNWFKKQGTDFVEIKTQIISLPVQWAWQKLEGKLVSSYHSFHKEI